MHQPDMVDPRADEEQRDRGTDGPRQIEGAHRRRIEPEARRK
jgi:hypothetical protein